jgi:hypothetical protein
MIDKRLPFIGGPGHIIKNAGEDSIQQAHQRAPQRASRTTKWT